MIDGGADTTEANVLMHYGILRKSGRYPWGSGDTPNQRNRQFLDTVDALKRKGMSEPDIASGFGMTTTQLRALRAIAKNEQTKANQFTAMKLSEKGMSNIAIGQQMGLNESSVRALLKPAAQEKADILQNTANLLKDQLKDKPYLDIGAGNENHLGISETKLKTAVAMLEEEGYVVHNVQVDQLGTGQKTNVKVLAPQGTTYRDIVSNPSGIHLIQAYSDDGGRNFEGIKPPVNIDSKRVAVRYGNEGGSDMDGVIQIRRNVDDISLGGAKYAQVRVAVDGTHYLKGMAMYTDDLPDGVDIRFNTNKSNTGNKLDAMKPQKDDETNPFGTVIRQRTYTDSKGNEKLSAMNIVNEEGDWNKWSKSISSQVLSKQPPALAKEQLGERYKAKQAEYDEIMSLTNPAVKKKLLQSFSDDVDASAVHLKAAALPRQRTQAILPINSLKDTEVYAPNFENGEKVVLVRYPHGGIFEIPELTVNNRNTEAKSVMEGAKDAIGINAKVAGRLSGADFDGDTVLVIPNNAQKIKTASPLIQLKGFDPQEYAVPKSERKTISPKTKQTKMGEVSNLITDMTIQQAPHAEIARAVRHSMVVIDAEKHNLDWKRSAQDNGISELQKKYQKHADEDAPGKKYGGASTLISRAGSTTRVPEIKLRSARDGGNIDPVTGKKVFVETGASYEKNGKTIYKQTSVKRLANTDDAYSLSSGTPIETVYADHSNRMKALANQARKDMLETPNVKYSPTANKAYSGEVASLKAKLNVALKNAPLERQAQLLANTMVTAKRQANPDMDAADLKKIKGMALTEARNRTGARKQNIDITPGEWTAIQSGAISNNFLEKIIANTKIDDLKTLATPRTNPKMTDAVIARARSLAANGATQAEIAKQLGVSVSSINDAL